MGGAGVAGIVGIVKVAGEVRGTSVLREAEIVGVSRTFVLGVGALLEEEGTAAGVMGGAVERTAAGAVDWDHLRSGDHLSKGCVLWAPGTQGPCDCRVSRNRLKTGVGHRADIYIFALPPSPRISCAVRFFKLWHFSKIESRTWGDNNLIAMVIICVLVVGLRLPELACWF